MKGLGMPDLLAVLYTKLELVETCFVYFCLVLFLGDDQNLSKEECYGGLDPSAHYVYGLIYLYIFF